MKKLVTREQWLNQAVIEMRYLFDEAGAPPYPKLRVSCGWPRSKRGHAIGEAWPSSLSSDSVVEIFISPEADYSIRVLDILMHELVHACVGNEHMHRGPFATLARKLGLEGKLTATYAGEALTEKLEWILTKLGRYPHSMLSQKKHYKQPTRMLKVSCGDCGFICRTTQKWLDSVGAPTCACGSEMSAA